MSSGDREYNYRVRSRIQIHDFDAYRIHYSSYRTLSVNSLARLHRRAHTPSRKAAFARFGKWPLEVQGRCSIRYILATPLTSRRGLDDDAGLVASVGSRFCCEKHYNHAVVRVVVKIHRSYCGADQYYDAVAHRCVKCSAICWPALDTDFCRNNCPGRVYNPTVVFTTHAC